MASVMWLGNVKFEEQGDETVRVVEDEALEAVSSLLRCDQGLLCKALTGRQIQAGREVIWQELRLGQVCDARDALAKALYAMQFDWLVERINTSLRDPKRTTKALAINILDIYGFEHFKVNSFEQLCINYANERLQQQFNKYLFKLEQEEYSREGIDWAHVDFEDNQSCVDLIEQKMPKGVGLLSLLDEECVFPKATDETYGEKLHANLGSHPNFSFKGHIKNEFTVHHYAGGVTYTTDGFLDKNKDAISLDLLQALQGSSLKLLQDLASTMENRQTAKNSLTVGSFFREQLRTLVDTLESTNLHFIRCIKPNPEQAPLLIENSLVLAQLRCCGVLEVVRIARAGYPTRYLHEQFADRYHILMPEAAGGGSFSGPPLDMCNRILKQFQIDPAMYQVGHTKLFFRAGLLGRMEDTWERMVNGAYTIQAFMRMAVVRSRFLHLRAAAIRCQANRKGMMQRMAYAELLRRHRAALAIASRWKAYQIRRTFLRTVAAAWAIQMAYRRWRLSLRLKIRRGQISKRRASEAKVEEERKREAARWDRVRDEFGGDWEAIRATMAWAGSIKAKYGGEEKVEAALASWEAGDHNPTAAPQPVLQASATTVPMASPADIAELERLRADREALLDDLQAEKGRREECEEKLEVAEEQWMTQMAALQEVLANVKREIAGTDVEAAVTVYAGDLEKFRDRLPAHHVAEAGVPRPTSSAPRAPPPVAKTTQSISETNMVAIQAINRLNDELEMRAQVYDDDIDFIREVKEGITEAPDMDPVHELRNLQHRFEAWKRDFKQRLHETKHLIRRGDAGATRRPSQTSVGNASLDTSMDLSESMELDPSQLHHTPSYSSNGGNTHQYRSPPNPYQHEKPSKVGYDSGTDASVNSYIAADMPAPPFSVAPESGSMEDKKKKKGFGKMLGFNRRAK